MSNQIYTIKYKNEDLILYGHKLKQEVLKLLGKYNGVLMGHLIISNKDFPPEVDLMDKIKVINSYMTMDELKYLAELVRTARELNASVEYNPLLKKVIIRSNNVMVINILHNYYVKDILENKYSWSISIYKNVGTGYITIDKKDYTHKLFKKDDPKITPHILLNKYFAGFNNGDNVYFIDFGKIGNKIFTIPQMDFLLITHSHIDHVGSFLSKENENLKPFIYTNLPTLELLKLRKTDFDIRDDFDELFRQAYVQTRVYFDDVHAEQFLSGHAYGSNFYIENYKQGFSALYITDINIKSRAFKSKSVNSISKYDVDILFIEFPLHKYKPVKLPVKERYIIGTTSGEYEEVLAKIQTNDRILVDSSNSMYYYELIRQKYKSYLSKELTEIQTEFGTFNEFLKSDYKYFFTTKGYALMYWQKYRKVLEEQGIKVYLTNTKTNVEGVKILSLKTHINLYETLSIIKAVKPKIVIFTHYNGSPTVYKIIKQIEDIIGSGNVYVSNPDGEWVKIKLEG